MPSVLVDNAFSGGCPLYTGNPYSGTPAPLAELRLVASLSNSGSVYVTMSGGQTRTSGTYPLSGNLGLLDGFQLKPGVTYTIPRSVFNANSGICPVFLTCDVLASGGFARVFWELF